MMSMGVNSNISFDVFIFPSKGNFPLVGPPSLDQARASLLDDWRFNEDIIAFNLQLLWFEGKPLVVNQPQNQGISGHLIYKGTAPIFVTTKQQFLEGLVREARRAEAADEVSEASMLLRRLALRPITIPF